MASAKVSMTRVFSSARRARFRTSHLSLNHLAASKRPPQASITLNHQSAHRSRRKASSIVARRDSQYSEERTTHLLFAAEAATFSNRLDSVVRFLKPATRCVNSNRFHRLCGGAAALRCIDPCEISGAHVHAVRQSIDAEVAR